MLTFDKIRELERNERGSKKLQRLPDDVMNQLRDYIKRKERISEKTSTDLMELENVKNTIKRFFEIRENKLLGASLDAVRTGLPPEGMTSEEEKVLYVLVGCLKEYREQFFKELNKEPSTIKIEDSEKIDVEEVFRVKKTLPEFVGPDMKIYKLKENDIVNLPKQLEGLLLKEGILEKVDKIVS